MTRQSRHYLSLVIGLLVFALLVVQTLATPPLDAQADWLAWGLFTAFMVFTTTFSIHFIGQVSLLPMATFAAFLVMGLIPTAWAALVSALLHSAVRYALAERLGEARDPEWITPMGRAVANTAMHTLTTLAAGGAYTWAGGVTPLTDPSLQRLPALMVFGLTYLLTNYLIAGGYLSLRGWKHLRAYGTALPRIAAVEAIPLLLSPLMALSYLQLGVGYFILFGALLVLLMISNRLSWQVRQRLERRVNEFHSLHVVGKTLNASLDMVTILDAIHHQVARLMPAENFFVAFYNSETDEVVFPLALEDGKKIHRRSRKTGPGLTDHVIRTRAPLLMCHDRDPAAQALGVERDGRPAQCWLGVPLLAGNEVLGVMAVQSYDAPDVYDESHRDLLTILAAQAALAIQNARLFARTDEALARRVQELDSILRSVRDGVLLFDPDWRVVAANRALAASVGLAQSDLAGRLLLTPQSIHDSLLERVGYTLETLRADCQAVAHNPAPYPKHQLTLPHTPERRFERTLTPVRSREGLITAWLLVLRDVTEEHEVTRLRDEMTHMLIHDLRAPLSVLISSLDTLDMALAEGRPETSDDLLKMARHGSSRLMLLINTLLDINKLEGGQMRLLREPVIVEVLLREAIDRLAPAAEIAHITLNVEVASDLPGLNVDAELMGRVLTNLLDNALKFTPDHGQVQLWARTDETTASLLLGVTDSGPGIPAQAQAKLFKKFQPVTTAEGRRRGTGLGLAFCKLVVEAHGGRIWAESAPGQGTTFVMSLPLTPPRLSPSLANPPP